MAKSKRFLLFFYMNRDQLGGINDMVCSSSSIIYLKSEIERKILQNDGYPQSGGLTYKDGNHFEIFDLERNKVVFKKTV